VRCQADRAAVEHDLARHRIDRDAFDLQRRILAAALAAIECPQARYQFIEGKRLHQIIVRAEIEAADSILGLIVRRQNQNMAIIAFAAQSFEHRQSIDPGQHQIENDDIVVIGCDIRQGLFAVVCLVQRKAILSQAGGERTL